MKKSYTITIVLMFCLVQLTYAQLLIDGELRPRAEYRNGFGNIIDEDSDPGFGVATRMRLNGSFEADFYKIYISVQDVIVWGENRQVSPLDQNDSFAVFQAWAELNLGSGWSTRLGRQILSYDDERILGALDWAQQGRNHDAALIKYKKNRFKLEAAFAFNQDHEDPSGFRSIGTSYGTTGFFSYKTMQMLYLRQGWNNFSGSLLFLNNGFQKFDNNDEADGVNNIQTLGSHLNFNKGRVLVTGNAFVQMGDDREIGFLLGLDAFYKLSDKVTVGAGVEVISGDQESTTDTDAFFPLYGTNHKFNGLMDYFYVGNHANSIGLSDIHVSANFDLGRKSSISVKVLSFSGEQYLSDRNRSLGTEVDLVFKKTFNNSCSVVAGYSQMFASDGMYELMRRRPNLSNITKDTAANVQNWGWIMLVLKPKFLNK
ncbi:alginate export family protein [Seonamhaeicola marinus]|uniref:Alginate export domain-containing protein n=1 Tax=Seonamhaeicola marinus TaxID=1912246 RepID=A0A5D0JAY9_9FLAO|nr:alginate export family protein [Seonamhaeicola marinus]TYA92280.1 hypothetical protein FUA24_02275 [Seonamhaeicola marinus]